MAYYPRQYEVASIDKGRHRFPSCVLTTPDTLAGIIDARGLGEIGCSSALGHRPPVDRSLACSLQEDGVTYNTLHMAAFVAFVALSAVVAKVEDVLGDKDLLHEMIHHFAIPNEPLIASIDDLVKMARRIERAIPGYPYV